MVDTLGGLTIYAMGVAASPVPIAAAVAMIGSRGGMRLGSAYLLGWVVGLAVLCGLVSWVLLPAASDAPDPGWLGWLNVGVGVLVIALGVAAWRARSVPGIAEPRWVAAIDALTARRAWGFGVAVSFGNPKVISIALAAVATLSTSGMGVAGWAAGVVLFVTLGSIGVASPLLLALVATSRAPATLARFRVLIAAKGHLVLTPVFLVIGAVLLYDGLSGLR
jgi:threonine/homoserine/homoserine lactone efflux protein